MKMKVSSQKRPLSTSGYSDPEEKEISEDEDDDRNHKHRKRDTHSQSFEGDSLDHVATRPYNKRSKPFVNGYSHREGNNNNNNNYNASVRDFSSRFDKRRFNQPNFSRAPLDLNQRIRGNQTMPVEGGPVRNRGMDSWGAHDSRLGMVDIAPGPIPGAFFAGGSNAFGLIPGVSNGGLPPLGFQGALHPAICPPMIPRQRCRDFEERGFCLRGDMCPMEHGMNRIVVDDVQSLSQFNLPGSQLLAASAQGAVPGSLLNNKAFNAKTSNPAVAGDSLGLNGGAVDDSLVGGPDVYDPDQLLWANDKPETSSALLVRNQPNIDETESLPDVDPSDPHIGPFEGFDDEHLFSTGTASGSQNSSVWGRVSSSKRTLGLKEKNNYVGTSSSYLKQDIKSEEALQTGPNQGQWTSADKSLKSNSDSVRNNQKPSQKALRTLFVKGIPLKDNRRETLLSHFQKFGQVIDIYIPTHSERAFVQFSKREEAEAALKSPDAVMGNRFIKLWWANRDNISDDTIRNTNGSTLNPAHSHPIAPNKQKENPQRAFVAHMQINNTPVPAVVNSPNAPPVLQKKLENLELLKEELRKKQELLAQKRNEFKSKLDKLQKQATGTKDLNASDPAIKELNGEISPDQTKAETFKPSPKVNIISQSTSRSHSSLGTPFVVNRFKLDNRPTAFTIVSPIPAGLSNAAALEQHFSTFGDFSSVELEEPKLQKTNDASEPSSDVSARVSFKTRRSAEKAFLHGKCWEGHNLQFKWINSDKKGDSGNASTSNARFDTAEASSSHSQKITASKSDEPENQTRENEVESIEQGKDSKSVST